MADIVVVTATFYKEKSDIEVRLPLALETVRAVRAQGLPIIVVDSSPDPGVGVLLRNVGAEVLQQDEDAPGFGNAVRQTIAAGASRVTVDSPSRWL